MFVISVSGPQCSGKTTIARALGQRLGAITLSRDPLMGALKDSGYPTGTRQDLRRLGLAGYRLQEVLVDQLLGQGHSVVLECIATAAVRDEWKRLADRHSAQFIKVDAVVSDRALHRERLEGRENSGKGGWRRIEWTEVEATISGLGPPSVDAVVVDAINTVEDNLALVVAELKS